MPESAKPAVGCAAVAPQWLPHMQPRWYVQQIAKHALHVQPLEWGAILPAADQMDAAGCADTAGSARALVTLRTTLNSRRCAAGRGMVAGDLN